MNTSQVANPVAYIWYWLSCDNGETGDKLVLNKDRPRSEVIADLVAEGISAGTASTQRFKFLKASDDERKTRAARVVVK